MQLNPVTVQSVHLAYAIKRITKSSSRMGFMLTPNFSPNLKGPAHACLGDVRVGDDIELAPLIEEFLQNILTSEFNKDHFEIQNQNCPDILIEARDLITIDKLQKQTSRTDKEQFTLNLMKEDAELGRNKSDQLRYLLGWERLSKDKDIGDFLKELTLPITFTYKTCLDKISAVLGGFNE